MTPRERVQLAIEHQEPDCIPIDLGGGVSSMTDCAYKEFKEYLQLRESPGKEIQPYPEEIGGMCTVSRFDERVLQQLDVDLRRVWLRGSSQGPPQIAEDGSFVNEWGIRQRKVPHHKGYYLEMVGNPLKHATIQDLESYPWPDPYELARTSGLQAEVEYWYNNTAYALVGGLPCGGIFESCTWLRGLDQFLMDLILDKEFCHALMSKVLELHQGFFQVFLDIVGPYIEIIETADDLGMQTGLLLSPALYREMVKPYHQALFGTIKSKTQAKIFFHSCGSVVDVIDELIDVGVDILNPVQPLAKGMDDPEILNKRFGKYIVFHGGIDIQNVLPHGTIQDVHVEVKKRISGLAPGGGYILGPAHNIQVDVPPQNIVAMFDAARKYGVYSIARKC